MDKKAESLSMSTIIIAAIALLILVILATFILNTGGDVREGTSCSTLGGECEPQDCSYLSEVDGKTYVNRGQMNCVDGEVCCVPLG